MSGGYVKINGGQLSSNTMLITTGVGNSGGGNCSFSGGNGGSVSANQYYVNESGASYGGQTTGVFSVQANVGGTTKWVTLNFKNGILIGASGF